MAKVNPFQVLAAELLHLLLAQEEEVHARKM
jgi:hypothetical protein